MSTLLIVSVHLSKIKNIKERAKYYISLLQVQITRDLGHATIIWKADESGQDDDTIQMLLNKYKNDIR